MKLVIVAVLFIFFSMSIDAGFDIEDSYGSIIAVYRFKDASDSGPKGINGDFNGDASIVRGRGKNLCLRFRGKGSFNAFNDSVLALINEFSIVAWVKLKKQKDVFNIGMHGLDDPDENRGYASLSINPDGNLCGWHYKFPEGKNLARSVQISTKDANVSDNQWHHIAFTRYADMYTLYLDGNVVGRRYVSDFISFVSDSTSIYATNTNWKGELNGNVLVDEMGFFELGFSVYEIRAIYKGGFNAFIKAMPVEPSDKIALTWGGIKRP